MVPQKRAEDSGWRAAVLCFTPAVTVATGIFLVGTLVTMLKWTPRIEALERWQCDWKEESASYRLSELSWRREQDIRMRTLEMNQIRICEKLGVRPWKPATD